MTLPIPAGACRCSDPASCHDPESHNLRLPIRFAEEEPEPDAPEFLCIDCGDVEVSDEGERCAECWMSYGERCADDAADHEMGLREGR